MTYKEIIEEKNTPTGVLMFDKYTFGNLNKLIENSESAYFPSGSYYADVPVQFFFDEFLERFSKKIKWISIGPKAYLSGVGEVSTDTFYFDDLDKLDEFLEKRYGYLLIYTINKQLEVVNPLAGYKWRIRMAIVSNKEDIRDEKLEDILN